MSKMLDGVRVLDLTSFFSGPLCGYMLAQMGADVVKVEEPKEGDPARRLGQSPALSKQQMGAAFLASNAGKRSIAMDLKTPEGVAIFRKMVEQADVVIENFRPGVMTKLGIDYPVLSQIKPDLIYCAISGFGQTGPMRGQLAFDQIIQGFSGLMSITGTKETGPTRVGFPISDAIAGVVGALAVTGALNRRQRTGEGEMIDVSMLDSLLACMGWAVTNYLIAGVEPQPMGNDNFTASPSGTFRARDGSINIAINTQAQYERLLDALGRPAFSDDPRFSDIDGRKRYRPEMNAALEASLAERDVTEWMEILQAAGVPSGRVLSVPEVFAHPQVAHRDLLQKLPSPLPELDSLTVIRPGFKALNSELGVDRPPPRLGGDTTEILAELGYDADQIAAFRLQGVI